MQRYAVFTVDFKPDQPFPFFLFTVFWNVPDTTNQSNVPDRTNQTNHNWAGLALSDDSYRSVQEQLFKTTKMVAALLIALSTAKQQVIQRHSFSTKYYFGSFFDDSSLVVAQPTWNASFLWLVVCLSNGIQRLWAGWYCLLEIKIESRGSRLILRIKEEKNKTGQPKWFWVRAVISMNGLWLFSRGNKTPQSRSDQFNWRFPECRSISNWDSPLDSYLNSPASGLSKSTIVSVTFFFLEHCNWDKAKPSSRSNHQCKWQYMRSCDCPMSHRSLTVG